MIAGAHDVGRRGYGGWEASALRHANAAACSACLPTLPVCLLVFAALCAVSHSACFAVFACLGVHMVACHSLQGGAEGACGQGAARMVPRFLWRAISRGILETIGALPKCCPCSPLQPVASRHAHKQAGKESKARRSDSKHNGSSATNKRTKWHSEAILTNMNHNTS